MAGRKEKTILTPLLALVPLFSVSLYSSSLLLPSLLFLFTRSPLILPAKSVAAPAHTMVLNMGDSTALVPVNRVREGSVGVLVNIGGTGVSGVLVIFWVNSSWVILAKWLMLTFVCDKYMHKCTTHSIHKNDKTRNNDNTCNNHTTCAITTLHVQ
jgi:hypothetical protein